MRYELERVAGDDAEIAIEIDEAQFGEAVSEELARLDPSVETEGPFVLLASDAVLDRHPDAQLAVRFAVHRCLGPEYFAMLRAVSLAPLSEPRFRFAGGGSGEPLRFVASLAAVRAEAEPVYRGLAVSCVETFAEGDEVEERVRYACRYYGVADEAALVEKTALYGSVEQMRAALEVSLAHAVDDFNRRARAQAASGALIEANPIEVSRGIVDELVDSELSRLEAQVGSETLDERLASEPYDRDSLKKLIRSDVKDAPRLDAVLARIAATLEYAVSDDDRRAEIAVRRSQSAAPDQMEPVEETLAALAREPEALASLDRRVMLSKAFAAAMESMDFSVRARIPLREAAPRFVQGDLG